MNPDTTGRPAASAAHRLEPSGDETATMLASATAFVSEFVGSLDDQADRATPAEPLPDLTGPPPDEPGDFDSLLRTVGTAAGRAADTTGPGCFAYFPGGGLLSSAIAEMLARVTNRYTSFGSMAEELVAMEHSILRWLCDEFGLPGTAGGVVTTGASSGTLSVVVAARERLLGGPSDTGTLYVTEHTHHCVAKAARIAGFAPEQVRVVPAMSDLRMDPHAAEDMIAADRLRGRRPFLLVGTAGTTNTGTVDKLSDLAAVAERHQLWFHVDAAYGGGFQLTERGRGKLSGIELADSVILDAHKSLFLPYTTGILLARDLRTLRDAHVTTAKADYLQNMDRDRDVPDYADLGNELSREYRGLRLWFPLHLHGVGAFRAALDEKLDLSEVVHRELLTTPNVRTLVPDLTVHAFRVPGDDHVNRRLLDLINATGTVSLTSTQLYGETWLRMCVLNHRTHRRHVVEALDIIRESAATVLREVSPQRRSPTPAP